MKALVFGLLMLTFALSAMADTTVVATFVEEFHNWADAHDATFAFPSPAIEYNACWMTYEIGCPGPPGDCDPWDRLGKLSVLRQVNDSTTQEIEIARIITPYDITGAGRPGTCSWEFDMIEYLPLLRDSVRLRSFIESWIGGNRGRLVHGPFYFVEGDLPLHAYRIEPLWNIGRLVIGDPADPVEDHLPWVTMPTDAYTEWVTVRIWTTGHGQGNTQNAAEFSHLDHGVWVNDQVFEHELWRSDCESNPCSPQGGTWQFDRAGWCPGARVFPWDQSEITFTPGQNLELLYFIEAYENFCRPNNPDCVPGPGCPDCNYNSTGHTEPNYHTTAHLIYWTSAELSSAENGTLLPRQFALAQNYPNPFNPLTTIAFSLPASGATQLTVFDLTGRTVAEPLNGELSAGDHRVTFDAMHLASGVYLYSLSFNGVTETRKMVLLK